jgi:hypothetical protein
MMRSVRPGLVLGILALIAAGAATAATISSPLHPAASTAKAVRLAAPGQEGLDLNAASLPALLGAGSEPIRVQDFPIAPGVTGRVLLKRFEVSTPDARITVGGPGGDSTLPFPSVAHFSGKVEGEPDSAVYVGLTADRLVAYVRSGAGLSYIGPDESNADYIVRAADSPLNGLSAAPWTCGQEEMPAPLTASAEPSYPSPLTPMAGLKQAAVRVETDWELLNKFGGNVTDMASWVTTLYGAANVIYERDLSLHLALAEIHAWPGADGSVDPYVSSNTRTQLDEVGDWWHANRPTASYPRALVHFLSGKSVSGGIAWVAVLCSGDFSSGGGHWGGAYGLTQVYGSYPLQMWDQMATAHEMGHNAGSVHTHCYTPAIDHCYNAEPGCYNGPVENPGVGNGTIMSYCHLLGWQYISLVFHARCINEQMLPEINSASCLTQASTFIDVPPSHPYFDFVETLAANGVTSGCGGNYYCPDAPVSRAQMAVFLLKSKLGSQHVPPPATGGVFDDVAPGDFAADWIEELASLGITAGCTPTSYCPDATVTREQMAAFLLKTLYGSSHVPPAAASAFSDVAGGDNFEPWIMELYNLRITVGCATGPLRYCPGNPNSRGEMAVFLVRTFNLQ